MLTPFRFGVVLVVAMAVLAGVTWYASHLAQLVMIGGYAILFGGLAWRLSPKPSEDHPVTELVTSYHSELSNVLTDLSLLSAGQAQSSHADLDKVKQMLQEAIELASR